MYPDCLGIKGFVLSGQRHLRNKEKYSGQHILDRDVLYNKLHLSPILLQRDCTQAKKKSKCGLGGGAHTLEKRM